MLKKAPVKYVKNKSSNQNQNNIQKKFLYLIPALFFLSVSLLYLKNLTRDIYAGDLGDLVTAAYVFGVPHPPGYALFTLLGSILSHIPFPLPIVSRVGLISIMSSILSLFIIYKFSYRTTKSLAISILSVSILAFSYPFWMQAEIPEVFALNNFLAIIILYFAILFYQEKKSKYLYLLAFFSSLSLTHHNTILTIFPSVLILTLKHWKFIFFESKKRIIFLLLSFILGLTPFLYIPIAASYNPPINWDNVSNLNSFFHLILRKDYGALPITSSTPLTVRIIILQNYFSHLFSAYSFLIIIISMIGIFKLLKSDKRLMFSFIIAFFLSGPTLLFYIAPIIKSSHEWGVIERIYVLSFVTFIFFVPFGFLFIKNFLDSKFSKKIYTTIIIFYFFIIPIMLIIYNLPKTDLSKTAIGNTFALNILLYLPKNSTLFTGGDTTTFNIWYQYYALGIRPDIYLINPHGIDYLKNTLNKEKIAKTKSSNSIKRANSIFSTHPIKVEKKLILVPKGLVFEIIPEKDLPSKDKYLNDIENILGRINMVTRKDLTTSEMNLIAAEIPLLYSNALLRIGNFINSYYNDQKIAMEFYEKALSIDNENSEVYFAIGINQYKLFKDCRKSEENIKKAISYYPVWKTYYSYLYIIYDKCNKDQKTLTDFKDYYKKYFNKDIDLEKDFRIKNLELPST
ncbi:MAG: hypothetical protein A2857_02475 [Candidatus Levybacteria bacterium RIFCSPHIGHO2_01_FULL_36_15]|nr:MAG: hypothetical protein A2857_02475 [Candidatus Levybacteria bacterium RIFCSPHIGHO2_01_FULL_36_15]